jgi:hypothetical protein
MYACFRSLVYGAAWYHDCETVCISTGPLICVSMNDYAPSLSLLCNDMDLTLALLSWKKWLILIAHSGSNKDTICTPTINSRKTMMTIDLYMLKTFTMTINEPMWHCVPCAFLMAFPLSCFFVSFILWCTLIFSLLFYHDTAFTSNLEIISNFFY